MGNSNIKTIILVLVVLFSINSVLALGVSSPYWDKNPLKMYPGQIKEVSFTLTNKPDAETETAFVVLEEDAGIAELISGTEYSVAPGTTNTKIVFKISMPETATIGDSYGIRFSAKSAPSGEEGTVQLTMGYDISFPVNVVAQSEVSEDIVDEIEETDWILWAVIIIIVLIILYFIFRKKR